MKSKRVLITGATGFIGRALARHLSGAGWEVVTLTRDPEKGRRLFGDCCRSARWDGRSTAGWGILADGAEAIVNLAGENLGEGRWTRRKKARLLESRLAAGAAVVEAVRAAAVKPRVVIQASAIGYYGSRGDEELDERSAPGTGFLADLARRWEDSTREVEDLGVRRVLVRSGLVLGRGGGVLPDIVAPFRFFAGGPVGNGRQWMSWISLEDEILALRFLVERDDLTGVFNLAAPMPLTESALCRLIGRAMRRACWLPAPGFLLRLFYGEKAGETVLASTRVLPRRLLQAGYSFEFPHPEPFFSHLRLG